MRYVLLAATAAAAFVVVLAAAGLAPVDLRWPIVDGMIRASKIVALFGCLIGALSFQRHQHLFRGWSLLAAMYALLVTRDAVLYRNLVVDVASTSGRWIELAVVLPANVLGVLGFWTMASAWYVGGIALPGTRATRRLVRAAAAAMAVSIMLPAIWVYVPRLSSGSPMAIMGVGDAIADAVSISLIAPVLLTALALRGAAIAWPWALLTASAFGWLCYDATFSISSALDANGEAFRALGESFHALACVGAGMAGIAQRLVVTAAPPRRM
ncbi:MAG: uncharacterized protein JWO36_2238 [Myxococcales bacterium]|nr:uncharacterized protein [Myxococcales bacterium]